MTDKPIAPTYTSVEDVENLEQYCEGEFHPIHIGDQFHDRYRIVNKLGYGSYSTVWLVKDEQRSQYSSLKITTADYHRNRSERQVLHHLDLTSKGS